ncbi:uncharacterized protein LOC129793051 [Lutzomyia longipalpis]|uniref:uncharacterized protein LOC129793051 n=1 Tax=Lutzomyia longipalpis TaxID=7200 RepID=UPI002483ED1C|nr:uncharacterized protein LOC129793051 [Lutzomyia longipalpis]
MGKRLASGAPAGASGGTGGKKKKRRKPKAKVPVVGTLKDLRDALPSLESLIKFRSSVGELKTGIPEYDNKSEPSKRFQKLSRKAQKTKRAAKVNSEHVARMNQLQTLMQDKMFKQNPRQVIAEHIRNTRKMEDDSPWDYEEFLGQNVPQK